MQAARKHDRHARRKDTEVTSSGAAVPALEVSSQRLTPLAHPWKQAAPCSDVEPDEFFEGVKVRAKRLELSTMCARCPVVGLCVASMLGANTQRTPLLYGYWGGIWADTVTGKATNYVRAIATSAVASDAGNEASYIATRFLMEQVTTDVRRDYSGAIPDDLFADLVTKLSAAGLTRLADQPAR